MTLYTFAGYKGRAECTFDCPSCGKSKRKRSFVVEHTVNPFNKNLDGSVKDAKQVSHEARLEAAAQRDEFMREPLCRSCEDALSYADLKALRARRRGG